MESAKTFFLPFTVALLLFFWVTPAWAGEKISVVQYELKPVATVDSGKYIKTEWNAKIRNRASESVRFSLRIVFIGSGDETLKESTSQCELQAHETKAFKDTVLVEASIASKIASTKVKIDELEDTGADAL